MSETTVKICLRCIVSGEVQGVFYRATTQRKAQELGVTGWAKNRADGSVEVLVCGEGRAVYALADWLWQGSPSSNVSDVVTEEVTYRSMTTFETG